MKDKIKKVKHIIDNENFKLIIKISCITISILLFFGAMFVAMNETKKTIDGRAVSVIKSQNGFSIAIGNRMYQIEKDDDKINSCKEYIKNNHYLHPLSVEIVEISKTVSHIIVNLFTK